MKVRKTTERKGWVKLEEINMDYIQNTPQALAYEQPLPRVRVCGSKERKNTRRACSQAGFSLIKLLQE